MKLACRVAILVLPALGLVLLHAVGFATGEKRTKQAQPAIVKKILKVDYVEEEINPPNLVVTAIGQVPTGGWTKPTLTRVVYVVPPNDGIQDYILFATPPSGPATDVLSTVKATDRWKAYLKEAPWIKGIRVHGIDDGVVVKMFKGK